MVASNAGKRSVQHIIPELLHGFFVTHRRRTFGRSPFFKYKIFCKSKIVRAGLRRDRKALMNRVFDYLGNHRMADMADVYAAASGSCHIDHILCRHIFRPYIMGIQEVTDFLLIASSFFCFCFFLSLKHLAVFLAVESAQSVVRL